MGGSKVREKDRKTFGAEFEESGKKGGWGLKARGCLFPRVESDRNVAWGRGRVLFLFLILINRIIFYPDDSNVVLRISRR